MTWQLPIGAQLTQVGATFRVWAPVAQQVAVVLFPHAGMDQTAAVAHALTRTEDGYWQAEVPHVQAGARYAYSVDGGDPRPDPASRFQPDGVHAPSAVVDPQAFRWSDGEWRGRPLDDLIIYELHVGTATEEGTFDALIPQLPYFAELGITALEIMPIHDFPGHRNWGYDGVNLYAPANSYGGPEGFKRLVDAAHALGLAIILDVVYNHFGPDGNYLSVFSPNYFTDLHHTPWGDAINLDGEGATAVRDYLINNALYWAHEYHIDGLRMDATHALIDESPVHILQQLTETVRASLPPNRHFVITAEDERNDARLGLTPAQGGYGIDAIWADDFHHEARIALTGEQTGYYADYAGTTTDLARTIRDGWFYQGQRSTVNDHLRGTDPQPLRLPQFVYCIQNHDQVGNRPLGDRLNHVVDPAAYRALSALLLLVPQTPLLFQGQEWAASTPFLYFTDHNPELGKLVTEGRRKEFEGFWRETHMEVPDPQAEATFAQSKLQWNERHEGNHAATLALYHALIRLRRIHPALLNRERDGLRVAVVPAADNADANAGSNAATGIVIHRQDSTSDDQVMIVVNLAATFDRNVHQLLFEEQGAQETARGGSSAAEPQLQLLLDTNAPEYGGDAPAQLTGSGANDARLRLAAPGVVVLQRPR